jgi:hypothetical protein
VGVFGKIDLFLPAYRLGVLNVEAFIRLEAPCQVLTAVEAPPSISISVSPARNSTSNGDDMLRFSCS